MSETTPTSDVALTPDHVKAVLRRVKDPELNLNIVDLGLIYDVRVDIHHAPRTVLGGPTGDGPQQFGRVGEVDRNIEYRGRWPRRVDRSSPVRLG